MSTEYYEKLLKKYLDGQCTASEAQELYAWLETRSLLKTMQEEFDQAINTEEQIPTAISNRIEERLLKSISRKKPVYWRWAAAAAVLLLVGTIYLNNTDSKPKQITKAEKTDIAPGTNKAILTLANGETITLDSAGNQVITQGKTLVRQKNGQLQYTGEGEETTYNTLTVPRGGQFNIVLPDGSHVWLNAASSLKYPTAFKGKDRTVEIQGQGYFEIARNASQPFIVKVKDIEVQVLGTSFDIMAYNDENSINTTLVDGAVKVNQQRLQPGQQAICESGRITVKNVDISQVIAWKTGFFEFDNASLADIMRQLARWYDIDVNYSHATDSRLFGGRISRNLPLSDILHMLEANGPKFLSSGRKLIVN